VRVIGGSPEANGYLINQTFTPAQLAAHHLVVQFAGLSPTAHVDILVAIQPMILVGGTLQADLSKEGWYFTTAVSVNWLQ